MQTSLKIASPRILAFLPATLVVLLAQSCPAQESDRVPGAPHLLPQDTIAYIRLDNADDLRVDLAESPIGRMLNDPKMKPFANDVYATMNELFDMVSDQLGISLEDLLAIPSGQVSAAAMPGNVSEEAIKQIEEEADDDESEEAIRRRIALKRRQQNAFAGLFIIDADDRVDDLLTLVDRLDQQLQTAGYVRRTSKISGVELVQLLPPRAGRPEVEYFERQGVVVLGIGHKTAENALNQWLNKSDEPTLADNADFGSVMSRCVGAEETQPQMTFFVDPYHLAEKLVNRTGAALFVWPLVEELGLSKIRGVGGSAFRGSDEFADITHFHVLIDPPRDGFLGVLRPETGETRPPNWVPDDVSSYTSIYWNFEATYDNVDKIVQKFGSQPFEKLLEEPADKQFKIALRDDLLDNLTGRYVSLGWFERPVKLNSASQLHALELNDGLKMKEVIAKFRERRPNDLEVETIGGNIVYRARGGRRGNNFPEGLRRPEPCFVLLGNWVMFSDSTKLVEHVIRSRAGSGKRLIDVPEYELISSELGGKLAGEDPFMISYMHTSQYFRQWYDLAKSDDTRRFLRNAGENNPVLSKIAQLFERNELPPFDDFEKYFAPSGTFAYDEPSGIHIGTFTLTADD